MKILLDECVPKDFCRSFSEYECQAARRAGFGSKTNGELLAAAEMAGFNVLITVDKNIPYQQNFSGRKLSLMILLTRSNDLSSLLPHAAACIRALRSIKPGEVVRIGAE
jgi:predicted nuclease of predicted toxin-antitoxin system